ncbi:LysM peptidoglycan-binding domain-containing protein [Burkholderia pyrrocinia]|uniref:LysM peptidoglycan-binding domain-containing protein n=1 Tax=Burkholderia pyrrocinia TaxID=60550 RepID=UPI001BCD172B|nr:LysM peptidoglycan-binding domain-containing protein [Burkholderia pyrrocinia]QVN23622.1 LysM peptidoglycan-binding domain-containing protein [Burkholderia pyrrocinia]
MVAIVTGQGLGLQSSSSTALGSRGVLGNAAFGQTGEQIYVNAENGNLMLQDRDQLLLGQGINGTVYRAYNSLGQLNWREGASRTVDGLTGTLNAADSTITLTDWDGSVTMFAYDATRKLYVSKAGVGANIGDANKPGPVAVATTGPRATLQFDEQTNSWLWTDGNRQVTETYDASQGGRLVSSRDADGNTVKYGYDAAGRLAQITTAGGDVTYLDYDTAGRLSALRSVYQQASGQSATETTVRYTYDAQGRLSQVVTDLSPEDNSIADGNVYTTTYTYDGTSNRIASIRQTDGSRVEFTYALIDGEYRVAEIAQFADNSAPRITKLQYDLANRTTTITDPLGFAQQMIWNSSGQLERVQTMPSNGTWEILQTVFLYDDAGNVSRRNDVLLGSVFLKYDQAGNLIQQDGSVSGGTVKRTYGARNEVLTETVNGGSTTRYAYDDLGHLRYVVSAEGRITEYRYNSAGQRISEIRYGGATFDVTRLSESTAPSFDALDTWITAQSDRQNALRIDSTYDWRGNVAVETRYERLLADGTGDETGGVSRTRYIYDPHGRLLQRYVGEAGKEQVEQFAYDGLGRLLSTISFNGALTTYQYDDAHHTAVVTFANGMTRTSTYNAAGELVATADTVQGRLLSQTKNWYDADGRLRMTTDANGQNTHYLYNTRNQRVATIAPDGVLTEAVFHPNYGVQTRTVTYATRLSAAQLATLTDATGRPVERLASGGGLTLDTSNLRPAETASDRSEWLIRYGNFYSLDHTVDADGTVTQFNYDKAGRLIGKTVFANRLDIGSVSNTAFPRSDLPPADSVRDRTTRYMYDRDGLLRAELDPERFLTEYRYNAAGERIETVRYATPVSESALGAYISSAFPNFDSLIPAASAQDISSRFVYDARGWLAAEIDGEGYVTRYQHDAQGNVVERTRGQRIALGALSQPQQVPMSIEAAGPKGAVLEIWLDGVLAGKVTLTSSDYTRYTLSVSNTIPLASHTVEFRGPRYDPITVRAATLGNHEFVRVVATQPAITLPDDPNGHVRFTLNAADLVASASAPGSLERTTYAYDATGRLLEQVTYGVMGAKTSSFTYDQMGHVLTETQGKPPFNRTTTYRYDEEGRVVRKYSGEGSRILELIDLYEKSGDAAMLAQLWRDEFYETYTYDATGLRTSATDADGRKTLYYYDANGNLAATINAAGEVVEHRRDAFGDIEQTTAYAVRLSADVLKMLQGGRLTDDVASALAALDNADASHTYFSYSAAGRLTKRTDAMGATTDYAYNAFGEVTSQSQQVGINTHRITTYDYDRVGHQIQQATDPGYLNLITKAVYDAFGRVVQSVDANGVSRVTEYDRNGRVVGTRDAFGQTSTTYDAFNNLLTYTDRLGGTSLYTYSSKMQSMSVRSAAGVWSTTTYNEFGQVENVTDDQENVLQYQYDRDGLLKYVSHLSRTLHGYDDTQTHGYDRDHSGNVRTESDGGYKSVEYSYDAVGRVLTRKEKTNQSAPWSGPDGWTPVELVTRYEYDAKGQQVRTTDPSGTVTDTHYDLNGRKLTVVVDPDGQKLSTTFTYDGTGQVLTVTEGADSAAAKVTQNTYDGAGRLIEQIVDPAGLKLTTHYAYDPVGNLVSETNAAGGVTHHVYDAAGREIGSVGPTGTVIRIDRDAEGRIVKRTVYATPVSLAGLPERLTAEQLRDLVPASQQDEIGRNVYDADGRLRFTVDAAGAVTELTYDASNNVIRKTAYAGFINPAEGESQDAIRTALSRIDAQTRSGDRVTRMVYDVKHRLVATINAAGFVTRNTYNPSDQLVDTKYYATPYTGNDNPNYATFTDLLNTWDAQGAQNTVRETRWFYDDANRPVYAVDAEGYVTENQYDNAGRLAKTIRYARAHPEATGYKKTYDMWLAFRSETLDQAAVTAYRYDGAGRLIETTNALGIKTSYTLNALGRAIDTTVAAGTSDASTTHAVYDLAGNLVAKTLAYGTAIASTTRYAYDAAGRQIAATDPRGVELAEQDTAWALAERSARGIVDGAGNALAAAALTDDQKHALLQAYTSTQSYDAAGRVIEKADALHNVTRYQYDAFGNQVMMTDPLSATTVSFYDKLNRVVAQVSPENWVVGTQYDAFGNVTQVTDYRLARPGAVDDAWKRDGWKSDLSQILPAGDPADAVTRMEYDKLGRVIKSTDAEGYFETYGYDSLGNRTSYTNKLGGTFIYTYDHLGRMTSETLPVRSIHNNSIVVNRFEYDSRGNRTKMIEAQGLDEERTTEYGYDLLDRQVRTYQSVYLYESVGDAIETSVYDARGNLVSKIGVNGGVTTWYYDAAGRKTGQVSPSGTLTLWEYDPGGNATRTRIFGDPVKPTQGSQPPAPVDATSVRETRMVYDADGRLVQSRVMNVATGYFDPSAGEDQRGEYFITSGSELVTQWEYDGRGAVIAKTDPGGGRTLYFYNGSGKKTLEIDAKGYGIAYTLNERGDVTREIRFAKPYPDPVTANPSLGTTLINAWPRSEDDRITDYTWDRNGRKTSETRENVQFASVDGNGKLTQQVGAATTRYAYDGEGHLLRQVDANGNQYDYEYDVLGHRTLERLPEFTDYQGQQVRARTDYQYDGLGNITREIRRDGNQTQETAYTYNRGRIKGKWFADGTLTIYHYDLAGNVVVTGFGYNDADGKGTFYSSVTRYDLENREIKRYNGSDYWGPAAPAIQTEFRYNAYGELIGRRTNGGGAYADQSGVWQEYTDYDNAGRVVRTNFNDGISHLYMYDRNGNATLKVESMQTDLRGFAIKTGEDLEKLLQKADMMQTFTRYDARNQVIQIRQPKTSGSVPRISFSPVDIPIDGGVFANTQLSIGGWIEKQNRPVAGPVYTEPAEVSLTTSAGAAATASVSWNLVSSYIEIYSLDINLPDLKDVYGAYQYEVVATYREQGENLGTSRPSGVDHDPVDITQTQTIQTAVNQSGKVTFPVNSYVRIGTPSGDYPFKPLQFDYSIEVYVKPQNGSGERRLLGKVEKGAVLYEAWVSNGNVQAKVADQGALNSSQELQSVSNRLSLANHTLPQGARAMLYYRPSGSTEAFRTLGKDPNSEPGSYTIDVGNLPDDDYEMIFMAISDGSDGREPGTLLRRDGYNAHIARGGNSTVTSSPIPAYEESSRAGFLADASGSYIWTSPQTLNLYSVRDSALHLADHVVVKIRPQGGTTWNEERTLWRDPATGAFSIDLSGYAPGNLDVEFDLYNAAGQKLDAVLSSVGLPGGNGSPSFSTNYLADLKSTIVFHTQPADTDYIMVSWVQDGTTRYSRVTRMGNGEFTWDVQAGGLVPQPGQSYGYAIKYTAYDAAGIPLAMGAGDITVGTLGNSQVTLTGSERPSIFEFKPVGADGQLLTNVNTITLYYRQSTVKDQVYDRPFTEVTLTRDALGRFLFDASALPTRAEFEYRYLAKDATGTVLTERQSYFLTGTRNNPVTNVDIVGVIEETAKDMTIDRLQQHNAFGEVSAERDGRGNWTTSSYNTMGNLTLKHEPKVSVTLTNGAQVEVEPETRFYYDLTGNLVGLKDANGNLTTQQWNYGLTKAAVARTWDALGFSKTMQYDAYGDLRTTIDELGRRTDYRYDKLDRLIEVDRPALADGQRSIDRYEYDSLDRRIAHTDALGNRERTFYDVDGRVVKTISAAGREVKYDYKWATSMGSAGTATAGGWIRTTTNANGMTTVDENDQFGRLMKHTDFGGHVFQYTYNWAGLLAKQSGSSGQDVDYTYYSNGLVRSIKDNATKTQSLYEYDGDGNRTAEYFSNFGDVYVFAQSRVKYDALNRVTAIEDDAYKVYYEYDAVGNRRHMLAKYTDMVGYHDREQEYWYEYDALNRFTVSMGSLSGARATDPNDTSVSIVKGALGGDGVQLGYNAAGERVLAVYAKDGRTERYTYDANGYLTTQSVNDIVVQERKNDLLGRVTGFIERDAKTGQQVTGIDRTWDADGTITQERDTLHRATTAYSRMADGTLTKVETTPDDSSETRTTSTYAYEWWDSAKQSRVTVQASNPNAPGWRPATSYFNYDENGNLKSTYDDGGNDPGKARAFQYWTDLRGQVQRRDELTGVTVDANGRINGAAGDRKHNYYYLNGNRVGNQGNDGIDQIDYMQELAGKLGKGNENQYRVFTPISAADFDENYMAINGTYPAASAGQWTVRAGDTLKSVASALWGDSSLWYILADANGLKSTDELRAGQLLTVPNKVTNVHNTSTTFKPYDPGLAIGNTQPTLPAPPPPPGPSGCGGFMPIIAIVVAVVATVFTAGALTAPAGASFSAIMSAGGTALTGGAGLAGVGASVAGGAVGAAASQGVMIASGEQHGLDLNGITLGAIAAGVTAGIGAAVSAPANALSAAAQGAVRSVATQGIGVVTGLQEHFDWKGVAASAIASGVGYGVGEQVGKVAIGAGVGAGMGRFVSGVAGGLSAGVASTLVRGGSLGRNIGAIAADAVATTVGNMVADRMKSQPTSTALRTQQAIDAMNGQILPSSVGSAGTGFVPANAPYIRFENSPQASATMALANYDSPAGIEQARAQRIAELQLLADQPLDRGFSGVQVLIEGVGSTGGPAPHPAAELGTIRNLNWFESQLAFNPVAQAAQGFVDQGLALASGAWNVVSHPMNTVAAIGAHYANAYEAGNLGGAILRDASGIAAGAVKGALSPIDALYRQNEAGGAYRLGGSMMDAALSAATPGATNAAIRLTGAGLERGAAAFGPALDRVASGFLVNRGMLLNAVPESGGFGGAAATLSRVESRFASASREVGFIIDSKSGDILAVRRAGLGNGTQISLNSATDFPLMSGNVFTHNHPLGGNLSPGDVSTAIGAGVREFRAVTPTRTTSIAFANPPDGLIGAPGPAVLFMDGEKSAIAATYRAGLADGSLIPPTDLATRNVWLSDYFIQQLSARNPWIQYTVTTQ